MVCQGRRREREGGQERERETIEGMDGREGGGGGENRNAEEDSITHNEGKEDTGLG
jgi:hypothetical protein